MANWHYAKLADVWKHLVLCETFVTQAPLTYAETTQDRASTRSRETLNAHTAFSGSWSTNRGHPCSTGLSTGVFSLRWVVVTVFLLNTLGPRSWQCCPWARARATSSAIRTQRVWQHSGRPLLALELSPT